MSPPCLYPGPKADFTLLVTWLSPAGPGRRRAALGRVWRSPARSRGGGALRASPGVVDSVWRGRGWDRPRTTDFQSGYLARPPLGGRGEHVARGLTSVGGSHSPGAALANPPVFLLLSLTFTGKALVARPWSPVGVVAPAECPNLWLRPRDNSKRWITRLVCR